MKIRLLLFSLTLMAAPMRGQEFVAFSNSTSQLGSVTDFVFGDCLVDMNGDGLDDVVRVTEEMLFIDYQLEGGGFEQKSFPMTFENLSEWSIAAGDIDENGFNDLLLGASNAVSFIMANDDGSDYTEQAIPGYIFSQRSTFADIDNDGDLDAFVCHDLGLSKPYRNDGNGNMTEDQSLVQTIDLPGNYSAIWTDYDNDHDIDLYLTKCLGGTQPGDPARTNGLYRNNGDGTFTEVSAEAGIDDNAQSWSTAFEDFDNDGDFDAFIVNHDFQNRFYLNNGDGTFTDIIGQTDINPTDLFAWENSSGDFNNDGHIDIFSGLTKELYLNNGDLTFTGQELPNSPGAIGDVNNDGFLDFFKSNILYTNNGNNNNWLKINTLGIISNKNGIGARVEIYGDWGTQTREVRSGQSFSPMSSMQVHFGLGEATEIDSVIVTWPSGIVTKVEHPDINSTLDIQETGCLLPPADLAANGETTICPGDSVELSAPVGFDLAFWSNGAESPTITVTDAGEYSAILYDENQCASFANPVTIEFVEEAPPLINIDGGEAFCSGETITLTASEGVDFLWSNDEAGDSISVTESGVFTVSSIGVCTGDTLVSDSVSLTEIPAPPPIAETGLIVVAGESTLLTADGQGGEVEWYDAPNGGTLLGTGNSFETPTITTEYLVYPQAIHHYPGIEQSGGKLDFTGPGGNPNQNGFNLFDVWEPFILESVRVRLTSDGIPGIRTVQLVGSDEVIIAEKSFDLEIGEHQLGLGFAVPVGTNFTLRCPEGGLFRNEDALEYPYAIGEVGEITSSFFGLGYYYYFYDWKINIGAKDCASERVEVLVQAVISTTEELAEAGVTIFPNPAQSNLFVKLTSPASFIRLFDIYGREIIRKKTDGNETVPFDLTNFTPGTYAVQVEMDGKILNSKIIVE